MDDGEILDVGPLSDLDPIDVTANDRVEPNAGTFSDRNLSDDIGAGSDEDLFTELRAPPALFDHRRHREPLREMIQWRRPRDLPRWPCAQERNTDGIHRSARKGRPK